MFLEQDIADRVQAIGYSLLHKCQFLVLELRRYQRGFVSFVSSSSLQWMLENACHISVLAESVDQTNGLVPPEVYAKTSILLIVNR